MSPVADYLAGAAVSSGDNRRESSLLQGSVLKRQWEDSCLNFSFDACESDSLSSAVEVGGRHVFSGNNGVQPSESHGFSALAVMQLLPAEPVMSVAGYVEGPVTSSSSINSHGRSTGVALSSGGVVFFDHPYSDSADEVAMNVRSVPAALTRKHHVADAFFAVFERSGSVRVFIRDYSVQFMERFSSFFKDGILSVSKPMVLYINGILYGSRKSGD